jgi:membrane fusion protein (multidrug efflux system)
VVSGSEYDQKIRAAEVDAAALESDRATANAARTAITSREAAVKSAQAALDQALLNLEYTKLVAPMDGVVGKKTFEVGQQVQPGQQLLAIVPLEDIWVTANFKETQMRRMKTGQRATIYVDATGREYDGYVAGMGGASGEKYSLLPPENATGNYVKVVQRVPIRIRLKPGQDPDHRLRPGMSAGPKVWLK